MGTLTNHLHMDGIGVNGADNDCQLPVIHYSSICKNCLKTHYKISFFYIEQSTLDHSIERYSKSLSCHVLETA